MRAEWGDHPRQRARGDVFRVGEEGGGFTLLAHWVCTGKDRGCCNGTEKLQTFSIYICIYKENRFILGIDSCDDENRKSLDVLSASWRHKKAGGVTHLSPKTCEPGSRWPKSWSKSKSPRIRDVSVQRH